MCLFYYSVMGYRNIHIRENCMFQNCGTSAKTSTIRKYLTHLNTCYTNSQMISESYFQ